MTWSFEISNELTAFGRGQRLETQRVDVGLHQRAERSIYHPMTRQRLNAVEAIRDDSYEEVSSAIFRAGVTEVPMTLVDDL